MKLVKSEESFTRFRFNVALAVLGCLVAMPVLAKGAVKYSSQQKEMLKAAAQSNAIVQLGNDHKQAIVLGDFSQHSVRNWAWIEVTPSTADDKNHFDSMCGVVHKVNGKWQLVAWVGDEVSHAEDSSRAFKIWRDHFLAVHLDCPARIFPPKF